MNRSFRPAEHIRKRADFERIYEAGSKCAGRLMTVFADPTEARVARLGIGVSRKLGPSVDRNRAKRLIREVFRHHKPAAGLDVVVVPRRVILNAPYENIEAEFTGLLAAALAIDERRHSMPTKAALALIRAYKLLLSPLFAGSCRFEPSCASYSSEAIGRFGLLRGGWLGARRLCRCHPFGGHGYDPVPRD